MKKDTPAFPTTGSEYVNNSDPSPTIGQFGGITIRDYFAAKAMQSLCGKYDRAHEAKIAYEMADAMLYERDVK